MATTLNEAASLLAHWDAVLDRLIADTGPIRFQRDPEPPLVALTKAIVSQQIAASAAAAIFGRLAALIADDWTPEGLLKPSLEALRGAGLSHAKATAVQDLAARVLDGSVVLDPGALQQMSDPAIVSQLTRVHGIGPWTAEMFLLTDLRRLDVLPSADIGLRAGYAAAWHLERVPTPGQFEEIAERFRPYRSAFAWYCWRAAQTRNATAIRGAARTTSKEKHETHA